MKYPLFVDKRAFTSKPKGREIAEINQRIMACRANLTPKEIADAVSHGQTVVLADLDGERKKANLKSQQIVALDFDNTVVVNGEKQRAPDYFTVADVAKDPWLKQNAAFIYSTFSWEDDWERFRVVFFLDRPMTKNTQVEAMYKWLLERYPMADHSATDSSRLFFGGREVLEIDFDNVLDTKQVTFKKKKETKPQAHHVTPKTITNQEAKQAFDDYLEREAERLKDYNNALSVIWCLARAVKTKEISPAIAPEMVEKLAMGNEDWEEENQEKYQEAINTPLEEMHTSYTFAQKIMGVSAYADDVLSDTDMIKTSKILVEKMDIKVFNHSIYFKKDNHWQTDNSLLIREITKYVDLKAAQDQELIKQFLKRGELIKEDDQSFFNVQFRNKFYLHGDEVVEGESPVFTPYYLDVDYDPDAYNETVDDFLDFIINGRRDVRPVLEEMFGHILMVNKFPHKVFFFIGNKGSNGKSTLLEMVNHWVGEYGSNISLENFEDPTSVVSLEGMMTNVGDDIEIQYLEKSSNFKILASGNTITVRPIYQEPYKMRNRATLIFTANDMPTFKDKTGGIARRLVLIPTDNSVENPDFKLEEKLSTDEAKSYLLNVALAGLQRIVKNGTKLSYSKTVEDNVNTYLVENNSVLSFMEDEGIDETESQKVVYASYKLYCEENGFHPLKKNGFTRTLSEHGYESKRITPVVGSKQIRVYKKDIVRF